MSNEYQEGPRQVIQLTNHIHKSIRGEDRILHSALCKDGSMWRQTIMNDGTLKWVRIPNVPSI